MNLTANIKIVDLSLYLKKEKILIISDIHLGYEESLIHQGYLIPRHQYKDTIERLNNILRKTRPKTVIINGDLKHQFGSILSKEYNDSIRLLESLKKNYKVILIKGNHDKILDIISERVSLKTQLFYNAGNTYIFHGDFMPKDLFFKASKTIIIGHNHPAITIEKNKRLEKYKCFLKGKYKSKSLIIMPSFNTMTTGADIIKEKLQTPLINSIKEFNIYIVEDKVYNFGKVKISFPYLEYIKIYYQDAGSNQD